MSYKAMSRAVAFGAALITVSVAHAAGPFGSIHIGNWTGGAYTDDKTGAFSHCVAGTTYANGVYLTVGLNASGNWLIGFAHPAWQVNRSETFPFDVTFDGQAQLKLFATAASDHFVTAILPSIEQFRKAHLMVAVAKSQTYQFSLPNNAQLLTAISNCVTKVKAGGVTVAGDFSAPPPKSIVESSLQPARAVAAAPKATRTMEVSGTGFVISTSGHIITNHHVIGNCIGDIQGNLSNASAITLRVVSTDETNDLAVLQAPSAFYEAAKIRATPLRSGDAVVAIGYPFHGLLTSDFTVTTGIVSSLSGILNDTRYLQISAPVQPGNSGGPLFDTSGNIVGVVAEKFNALKFAKLSGGTIPENVNFAIKPGAVRDFLDNSAIEYKTAEVHAELKAAEIASAARSYTMHISCTAKE